MLTETVLKEIYDILIKTSVYEYTEEYTHDQLDMILTYCGNRNLSVFCDFVDKELLILF